MKGIKTNKDLIFPLSTNIGDKTVGKYIGAIKLLCIGEKENQKRDFLTQLDECDIESRAFLIKRININRDEDDFPPLVMSLMLWNIPNTIHMSFDNAFNYYQHALGCIFLFNVYDRDSFEKLNTVWIANMHKHLWDGILLLVGIVNIVKNENNSIKEVDEDLPSNRTVSYEEAWELAKGLGMVYVECDTSENTSNSHPMTPLDILRLLAHQVVERNKERLDTFQCLSKPLSHTTDVNTPTNHQSYNVSSFYTAFPSYKPISFATKTIRSLSHSPSTSTTIKDDFSFKYIVVGEPGCGKTSFINRILTNTFTAEPCHADFQIQRVQYCMPLQPLQPLALTAANNPNTTPTHSSSDTERTYNLKLYFFDITSLVHKYPERRYCYRSMDGIFLLYDITNRQSFLQIVKWIEEVLRYGMVDVQMILVGMKSDEEKSDGEAMMREVYYEEGLLLAMEYEIPFIECSNRTTSCDGVQVVDALSTLTHEVVSKRIRKIEEQKRLGTYMPVRVSRPTPHQEICTLC